MMLSRSSLVSSSGYLAACVSSAGAGAAASTPARLRAAVGRIHVRGKKTKATGVTQNKQGSGVKGKRLGIKVHSYAKVKQGDILVRQRGRKYHEGEGVVCGRDYTLTALRPGFVHYTKELNPRWDKTRTWKAKHYLTRISVLPTHPMNPDIHVDMVSRSLYHINDDVAGIMEKEFGEDTLLEQPDPPAGRDPMLFVPRSVCDYDELKTKLRTITREVRKLGIPRVTFYAHPPRNGSDVVAIRQSKYLSAPQ